MSGQLLNRASRRAAHCQVRTERVTQSVYAAGGQLGAFGSPRDVGPRPCPASALSNPTTHGRRSFASAETGYHCPAPVHALFVAR
jgi:hypothetical protein